jgi:hypothetical protein
VIPVIDRNYDENDAGTDNIQVMIPVIDRNCDINEIVTAYLSKSLELYRNSGHSPELRLKTLIYIVIPMNDRNYDVNYALTANIHVMIPVIDRNYDINDVVTGNHAKSREFYLNSGHSPELRHEH